MKTINLIKIALVILLGVTLSGKVQADNKKHIRYTRLNSTEMITSVTMSNPVIRHIHALFAQPIEGWMLEPAYLSDESEGSVETWMFETDYLDEETQPLESWMFNETRLDEESEATGIEPWMSDANYLSR